jgi:hypothetical protein
MSNQLAEWFAHDWLLVIENDHDSWNQLVDDVKSMDCEPIATTAYLREEWDVLVNQMATLVEDKVSEVGALLLRQMLATGLAVSKKRRQTNGAIPCPCQL